MRHEAIDPDSTEGPQGPLTACLGSPCFTWSQSLMSTLEAHTQPLPHP